LDQTWAKTITLLGQLNSRLLIHKALLDFPVSVQHFNNLKISQITNSKDPMELLYRSRLTKVRANLK